jgi:hypothetical protein
MDMPSHDVVQGLLNAHSWYHIETPLDYLRAGLWCLSNLATALAYFFIPNELRYWRRVLPFATSSLLGSLFIAFIAFCGLSHLAMLAIMQTAPWWAILLVYLPMAVVSVATVIVMRKERALILLVLESISKALMAKRP